MTSIENKKGIEWYTLDEILKYDVQYYMIYGGRSNGKSFAVYKKLIDDYFEKGWQFGLFKRFEEDMKEKFMGNLFPMELQIYMLEKYNHHVKFFRSKWYVYEDGLEGKISECSIFGYAFSLAGVNRTKATTYPEIMTLVFEEFMSIKGVEYLPDEINLLLNLVSTVARDRHNLKIFMLANAISKYSPYSTALGVKLHRIKHGDIITREYTNEHGFKTKFAIQRTKDVNVYDYGQNKNKIVYNLFGTAGVGQMITSGEFETHSYKRRISNVTFSELKQDKKDRIVGKKDLIPIALQYEDYFYKIYIIYHGKYILAFREMENVPPTAQKVRFLINGSVQWDGVVNIGNVAIFDDERINRYIDIMVSCMKMKEFITLTDDDGENVINAFRMAGLSLSN